MTHKKLSAILASLTAGLLLTLVIQFNSGLGKFIGVVESSFVAHLVGTILGMGILAFHLPKQFLKKCTTTPKYLFAGGIFGVIITVIANTAVAKLGILLYSALIITVDLAASTTIDHFGLFGLPRFPITLRRICGLCISLVGIGFILGVR